MIQSFIIYITLSLILLWLGNISSNNNKFNLNHTFWTWEIISALLIFSFISGLRWNVGVDHLSYLSIYENYNNIIGYSEEGYEIGFSLINKLFASLNLHYVLFFSFLAFIQIFFIYYTVKDERYLLPFIGFLIVLGPQYLSWMNGIRQMIAATIFVYSVNYLYKRDLLKYILLILLASTFHKSAILLIIFYFIPQKDYFKNKYLNLVLLALTFLIGMNPYFLKASDSVRNALDFIGYNVYANRLDIIIDNKEIMALGPRKLSILITNVFAIWYAPKLKVYFKDTKYLIYFNLSFVGILLYNIFSNTSHIFLRPIGYLTIFLVLTTSYLLYYLKPKKKNTISFSFLIVIIPAIVYTLLSVVADDGKGEFDWSNFIFFWQKT